MKNSKVYLIEANGSAQLVKMLSYRLEKKINDELKENDITFSQIRIITLLYSSLEGSYSLKDIEAIIQVSQQTVAGIVSRLEKKGLVEYLADASDKRVKIVALTDKGNEMAAYAQKKMKEVDEWFSTCLTEEEAITFNRLLKKVYTHVV